MNFESCRMIPRFISDFKVTLLVVNIPSINTDIGMQSLHKRSLTQFGTHGLNQLIRTLPQVVIWIKNATGKGIFVFSLRQLHLL